MIVRYSVGYGSVADRRVVCITRPTNWLLAS